AVHGLFFGTSSTTPLYTNSRCSGEETAYSECNRLMTSRCIPGRGDVGVVCSSDSSGICSNGQVILLPSSNSSEKVYKKVGVCFGNSWGYICPEDWDNNDAKVICRQLGLSLTWTGGKGIDAEYENHNDRLWLNEIQCTGNETRLLECGRRRLGTLSLFYGETASLDGDMELNIPRYSQLTACQTVSVSSEHLDVLNNDIIITSNNLKLMETIGKGEYGLVYKGQLMMKSKSRIVAVKTLKVKFLRMDEYNLLKVSDFGLSQEIYGKTYFRQAEGEETKLPIKWMAIESMTDGLFSEKTDTVTK
uniref:SRCR domain-containing protein n=1 Tax=Amphimedon queenslandica TaxID=400682 RepID=A0A1X7T388_AMPQE